MMNEDDIREEFNRLEHAIDQKANRPRPSAWATLIGLFFAYIVSGIWWAASISAEMKAVKLAIETQMDDRWRRADAKAAHDIMDQRADFLQLQISDLRIKIEGHLKMPWHERTGYELEKLQEFERILKDLQQKVHNVHGVDQDTGQ